MLPFLVARSEHLQYMSPHPGLHRRKVGSSTFHLRCLLAFVYAWSPAVPSEWSMKSSYLASAGRTNQRNQRADVFMAMALTVVHNDECIPPPLVSHALCRKPKPKFCTTAAVDA